MGGDLAPDRHEIGFIAAGAVQENERRAVGASARFRR